MQKLLTLPEHLSSPPLLSEICVAQSLNFCVVFCRSLFVRLSFFIWHCIVWPSWCFIVSSLFFNCIYFIITPIIVFVLNMTQNYSKKKKLRNKAKNNYMYNAIRKSVSDVRRIDTNKTQLKHAKSLVYFTDFYP
jgi:hypothetical protein